MDRWGGMCGRGLEKWGSWRRRGGGGKSGDLQEEEGEELG